METGRVPLSTIRAAWIGGLGVLLIAPVLLHMAFAERTPLWTQLSTITGLLALSGMVAAAILPSRIRSISRAFGIEGVIDVHRSLGITSVSLVLLHLACVVAANPGNVMLMTFGSRTEASTAATIGTVAVVGLVLLALYKSRLSGMSYELWRWSHISLAMVGLTGSFLHVWFLGHYSGKLWSTGFWSVVFGVMLIGLVGVLLNRWVYRVFLDPSAEFVVREVRRESKSISTLVLDQCMPAGGSHRHDDEPFTFVAGQFAWIRRHRSVFAEEHPFTIASGAHLGGTIEFTIRHQPNGFTDQLGTIRPGDPMWVDGPYGAFTSDDAVGKGGVVMISGGVGVTPMMSILRTAAARGDHRAFRLVLVISKPQDVLFRPELAAIASVIDLEVSEVLRGPRGSDPAAQATGLATALASLPDPASWDYFVCGSPSLVASSFAACEVLGVPDEQVRTEQFDMV